MADIAEPPMQEQSAEVDDAQGQPGAVESDPNHSPTDTPTNPTGGSEHRSDPVADGAEATEQARGGEAPPARHITQADVDEMDIGELNELTNRIANGEIEILPEAPKEAATVSDPDPEAAESPPPPKNEVTSETEEEAQAPPVEEPVPEAEEKERLRLAIENDVDKEFARLVKEERLTPSQAIARIRDASGEEFEIDNDSQPGSDPPTSETKTDPPAGLDFATTAEAEARLDELETEIEKADDDFDDDKVKELRKEQNKLFRQLPRIFSHEQAETARITKIEQEKAQAEYNEKYSANLAQAAKIYPDLAGDDAATSELWETMKAIDAEIRDADPDLWESPEKPVTLAKMAARRLGLAPGDSLVSTTTRTTSPAQPSTVPPRNPAAKGVAPVPVTRQAPSPAGSGGFAKAVDEVESIDDLRELEASLLRPTG